MVSIIKKTITEDDDDIRLDRWFKRHYPSYPFSMVAKLSRSGQIRVDGKRVETSQRVYNGQEVRFPLLEISLKKTSSIPSKYLPIAQDIEENLLYKDEHILVINKPAGIATQGGTKIDVSIDMLSDLWKFELDMKPKLVHRLDKDTSGILILARTSKAAQEIAKIFQNRNIKKQYLAILQGVPKPLIGVIDLPLEKKAWSEGLESVRFGQGEGSRSAKTKYTVLDHAGKIACLAAFDLITGRTHQIRAHCAEIGFPVLGDHKYNRIGDNLYQVSNFMYLHAYSIELELFGKVISVEAPPPKHFNDALKYFGLKLKFKSL